MSDKIKVAIRVRPLIEREKLEGLPLRWITKHNQIYQIDPATDKIKGDVYTFDHIFGASESNNKVFDSIIKPIIDASMQGFNGTVFAYGQTSSGKTYTMSGTQKCLGIIPLAINYIFYSIENTPGREFLLRVSYMEIYNEKVNDLLDISKKHLKIQEDCNGQVMVNDVEERVCKNSTEVLEEKMKGDKNRRIGETNMNERSSRSHTIFRIILESRNTDDEDGAVKVSHLNLVDLAGSERSGQSGATGDRFKEGCHINMSLTTLGLVINQLSDGQEGQFINFRDSKLTRLLQSSLGGNAMTAIVCAVTPAAEDQTQNTLSFASRAKKINNKPILNEVLSESALIKRYLKQIARLNQELEVIKQKSGISEVEAISNKLKEKEEMNKVLNERISRLKEALIVSSSSPARKKQKRMPREKRRHSWSGLQAGGGGGRLSFPGRSNTLTTIAEQSPSAHAISPPQANSTRLDETMCPFEKFELELMRDRNRDWSDMVEDTRDSIIEEPTITADGVAPLDGTNFSCDKSVDLTLVGQIRATPRNEGTPPFVLRQRINNMSTLVQDVVKEYDQLREFTTLEKQIHIEELDNAIKGLKQDNESLRIELKSSEEQRLQTEAKLEVAEEKITSLETELFTYKESLLEMEDNILKNSDVNLLKELAELKEVNSKIEDELKLKAEDFQKLKEQCNEVNSNFVKVTAEKDKLQADISDLIKKVKELETVNSDLEVTLDHKSRKSIERETELENELKTAWQALERREKIMHNNLIEKECLQLKKITIEETLDTNSTSIQDEIDKTVIVDPSPAIADFTIESTEKTNVVQCDTTFNTLDMNETVETTERINFISCDATLSNISIQSPTELSDPLKSFCLSESLIPVEIHDEEDTVSQFNTSTIENKMIIQDLCEILGEKDELKQKIIEMKSEAANIMEEYEEKKSDLTKMAEKIASYETVLTNVKEALNLEDGLESFAEIEKEINDLKQSKTDMEGGFKSEISKLTAELNRRSEFEQVLEELSKIVDTDFPSDISGLPVKISDLVKFRTSFASKLTSILAENEAEEICEEELVRKVQDLRSGYDKLRNDWSTLNKDFEIANKNHEIEIYGMNEYRERMEDQLKSMYELMECDNNGTADSFDCLVYTAQQVKEEADKVEEYSRQIIDLHDMLGEVYDKDNLSFEVIKCAYLNQVRAHDELKEELNTLKSNHDECIVKIESMKLELEEKASLEAVLNQLINSIQTCINGFCTKDNVIDCMETINKELSELRSSLQEQTSKLTNNEEMEVKLQKEIDSLVEKVENLESFITSCHSLLKGECNKVGQDIVEKSQTILDGIHNVKDLELQVGQLREEVSLLVKHKVVLEKMFEILSGNSDATFSMENILDEMTKYKVEFVNMQVELDKLDDCRKRILELENQVQENEIINKGFVEIFGKIRGELNMTEDMTVESLPELIIEIKNQALTSSDVSQKFKEFVNNCHFALNVSGEPSSENVDDKLASIVACIRELKPAIERANEENMSLKQHKEVLEKVFQIFNEGNGNQLSIDNVIQMLTGYKKDVQNELEKMYKCLERISELENQVQVTESKNKFFVDVFERIQAEFNDGDVTVESLHERIIEMKNQALSSSDVLQKLEEFINSCHSALNVACDTSSENIDDRLSAILVIIQNLVALKLESEALSGDNAILIKHKDVLEKILEVLREDSNAVISLENIIDEITKYKIEFFEMQEKVEKIDEYNARISEVADIKSKNNTFVQVFEKICYEFEGIEGDFDIQKLPDVIIKMKNELNEFYRFKLDVNSIVRDLSANESDAIYTTEELVSAIKDTEKKIASLNEKLDTLRGENGRLTEISSKLDMKLKEYMSIEGIISSLGTDLGSAMQSQIEEILERQIQSPELSKQIEKLVEFNRVYLELENKHCKTACDMNVLENTFRNIQSILGADVMNNIENVVKDLKNAAGELCDYRNLVSEISQHLSSEHESDISPENLLSAIVNLKNQISSMTEKMANLEARNMKVSETVEDLNNKMKYVGDMEQMISSVCSVLGVSSREDIVVAVEDLRKNFVDLKNDISKIVMDKDSYLQTIQCLFRKFVVDAEAINLPCDEELKDIVIAKADLMKNEISHLKELLNGIKQLLSDLSEVDLVDDEIRLEDVKNAIEDIKKNLCEVYELKIENMSRKTEVETMKEQMQAHFDCVNIVFNLCKLLSENVGKSIAKGEILNIIDNLLQKGTIPLDESSAVDMEESSVKVSEIDNLRIELNDLNVYFSSLVKIFDAEGLTNRDNLLQVVNNLKNDHDNLVSKYNSMQTESATYKESITKLMVSVCENICDDIGFEDKIELIIQHIHTLKDEHSKTLTNNHSLTDFQNRVADEIGVESSTPESTIEALKTLKFEIVKNQSNVDELKIQLEAISSEKDDLKEKVDSFVSVIRENSTCIHEEQECSAFVFYKRELLNIIEDYNSYKSFYNDLCSCLSDRVEELSKEALHSAVAAIKEENNCLNRALEELSANNEKIISDLNSAYESVELTKENKNVMEKLKVLLSGGTGTVEVDLIQSVTNLIHEKSRLVSELKSMESIITEKQDVHCELDKCQSLLRSIKAELDMSDRDSHNELLDAISDLKSNSDQAKEELSSLTEELRKCAEYLNLELSKINGKQVEREEEKSVKDFANMQLLCSKSLVEQLKLDSCKLVNQLKDNEALVENLKSEIDKQSETVKSLESTNNEREALLHRINVELEIQDECNELVFDSIKMLKDNLQQLRNENTSVKANNEELGKTVNSLKLELDESIKNGQLLKSEKDSLNMEMKENLETIEQLRMESKNLNEKLTDSSSLIIRKDEIISELEKRTVELQMKIECNEKLVESLKNEVTEQREVIDDLRKEIKKMEISAKGCENQDEVKTKIEETLQDLSKVQQKLDDFIAVDKTLKKKLLTEIKNMKSDFKPGSHEETSVQLLDSFLYVVMEKYKEVATTWEQNFEIDTKKLKEKINQLESKEKKAKEWIEQLEAEAESTNQDINAKSQEIEKLVEIVKKKDNELTNKSEDLENFKEHIKTCEVQLNSLRAENEEMANKIKKQLSEQNHSVSDSLKLEEKMEKALKEKDALTIDLNNKNLNISHLQSTVDSQQQKLKDYFDKLNGQQLLIEEKDSLISNLKDKNEACLQEIEDLKQELNKEKDECDRLSCSLNTMKAEYINVQQSLETNRKATEVLEGKLEEFFRDMNDTKAMTANLIESLKKEERKEQAERKALEKVVEEKTNQCNELKTKLYLLEMEAAKYNSTHGEIISKMKEEMDSVNKVSKELRDDILVKERTICDKQNECQRLENELADLKKTCDGYSRTLSLLRSDVMRKDQEVAELEHLKEETMKLQNCLKDKEMKCTDFSSRNSLLEKDLVERSNQITKLQLTLEEYEKELHDLRASTNQELDQIKIQLNTKEDVCKNISNTVALLEKQMAESEKIITKLKSDIICKDEDLSKMKKEVRRLSVSLEEATKSELKHQPKRLKLKETLNKFENFGKEKENNDMCLKLNTSHNTQQLVGCQKCKKLEKDIGLLFKVPLNIDENIVDKMKQSLVKLEELENKHTELQSDYKELDSECEDLNAQIKSLESECAKLAQKSNELTQTCNKVKEDYEKELATSAALKKTNDNLTKDLDACRVELERCREMVRGVRRERSAALHSSFREADRRQPMDLSASEAPCTPNAGDFKSIKHRWEQLSTSSQKHQPTPSRECQCEELLKQNQELKLELADKNNKVTLLEIQIQGQNFPYKKKAAALEEALNEAKTKIMTLKQEVRRLQTCLHDVSVFQKCETCRNKAKTTTTETAVQTVVTDTEASVSGSEIIQRQSVNILKEKSAKLERENVLLRRLCRDRNRKIQQLEDELKAGSVQKT